MPTLSFHFHGYQPGDIVRWLEPDPLKPQRFEERHSPVAHRIGEERIEGRNWTDAVLHAYGRMEAVLERAPGSASVDIEPQTLVWLLEKDPEAYRGILSAHEKGTAELALTPPFHPILPHHHRAERGLLFDLMFDFYVPVLRRTRRGSVGLWLPEGAYSSEALADYVAAARRAAVEFADFPDFPEDSHLLLDARQIDPVPEGSAWARLEDGPSIRLVARDPVVSGEFAFGVSSASDFSRKATGRVKDSVLVASDLETLLANPAQADRFVAVVEALSAEGIRVAAPIPPEHLAAARVVDFSSWSDYDEHLVKGHTSDTRWTGLRRSDGLVPSRHHRGKPLSQFWKHAFTLATERIETAVRRNVWHVLGNVDMRRQAEIVRRLVVAYGRHLFREHYRACGMSSREVDFAAAAEEVLRGSMDVELAGHLARGYVLMLAGLRSDPRFWDNPDTRVTFQSVALLSQSLLDVADACSRAGDEERAESLLKLLQATFLSFEGTYAPAASPELRGVEGWEITETAWHESLQSEVPHLTGYNVIRRAALYTAGEAIRTKLPDAPFNSKEVVADTGHVVGEAHGDWENRSWCEHRIR